MDKTLVLLRLGKTRDGAYVAGRTYAEQDTVKGAVDTVMRSVFDGERFIREPTTVFTIWHRTDVDTNWGVRYGDDTYKVDNVQVLGRSIQLALEGSLTNA